MCAKNEKRFSERKLQRQKRFYAHNNDKTMIGQIFSGIMFHNRKAIA